MCVLKTYSLVVRERLILISTHTVRMTQHTIVNEHNEKIIFSHNEYSLSVDLETFSWHIRSKKLHLSFGDCVQDALLSWLDIVKSGQTPTHVGEPKHLENPKVW